jgi:hypothetical protein
MAILTKNMSSAVLSKLILVDTPVAWVKWHGVAKLKGGFPLQTSRGWGLNHFSSSVFGSPKNYIFPAPQSDNDVGISHIRNTETETPQFLVPSSQPNEVDWLWSLKKKHTLTANAMDVFFSLKNMIFVVVVQTVSLNMLLHRCYAGYIHVTWNT